MDSSKAAQAMAASARDRLQGFWSSIRGAEEPERPNTPVVSALSLQEGAGSSIESVMRMMFGSCTNGMDGTDIGEPGTVPSSKLNSPSLSKRSRKSSRRRSSSRASSSSFLRDDQNRAERAVHSLRRQDHHQEVSKSGRRRRSVSAPFPSPFSQSDPSRRHSLQIVSEIVREAPHPPPAAQEVNLPLSTSFDDGISAISAHTLEELVRREESKRKHYKAGQGLGPELPPEQKPTRADETRAKNPRDESGGCLEEDKPHSPLGFTRGHSHGTHGTRETRSTKGTKSTKNTRSSRGTVSMLTRSTRTTQTSGFSSVWRREEQKYWDNVVQEDERQASEKNATDEKSEPSMTQSSRLRKSRSSSSRRRSSTSKDLRPDCTLTTGSCSVSSGLTSNIFDRHPHDTIQFETRDVTFSSPKSQLVHQAHRLAMLSDADRLTEVLILPPNTEMAEI